MNHSRFYQLTASFLVTILFLPSVVFARVPNDPDWKETEAMKALQLPDAWDIAIGSQDVVVAVIDTGVDIINPDLADNIWSNPKEQLDGIDNDRDGHVDDLNGWNFVDESPQVRPIVSDESTKVGMNHGTVVAGIIGASADNFLGGAGVARRVKIMPLKILDEAGNGDSDAAVRAIDYAIQHKADIINLSFVGTTPSLNLIQAVRRAYRQGITIVAAAGNGSEQSRGINLEIVPHYPVCFDDPLKEENWVLGVAALDQNGALAPFSNYGGKCIDISAPGYRVPSTEFFEPNAQFSEIFGGTWSGTSVAAPFVAGAAALIKSAQPTWGPDKIMKTIVENVNPIAGNDSHAAGAGSINVFKALKFAMQGGETGADQGAVIALARTNRGAEARLFNSSFEPIRQFEVWRGPVRGALSFVSGDFDNSGVSIFAVGIPDRRGSIVRVFQREGKLLNEFRPFGASVTGSLTMLASDFNQDGKSEIAITADRSPVVSVVDIKGAKQFNVQLPEGASQVKLASVHLSKDRGLVAVIPKKNAWKTYVWNSIGAFVRSDEWNAVAGNGASIGSIAGTGDDDTLYTSELFKNRIQVVERSLDGTIIRSTSFDTNDSQPFAVGHAAVFGSVQNAFVIGAKKRGRVEFSLFSADGSLQKLQSIKSNNQSLVSLHLSP